MPAPTTTLHLLCGKVAAGKSTLAARLASAPLTVLLSEDDWLFHLYGPEMQTIADYARCSRRLRQPMGRHIETLLRAGLSVVLDFPANTIANRRWMRRLFENAGAAHCLHYLDVPDDICQARLKRRNEAGTHLFTVSEAEFTAITGYFEPPTASEGFQMETHYAV